MTEEAGPAHRWPGLTRRRLLWGGAACATVAGVGGAAFVLATEGGSQQSAEFLPRFARDGLVTNEWAFRHAGSPQARLSNDWVATSGSLFADGGDGWTGVPDAGTVDAGSTDADDSAVFRLVSRRRDFGDVTVSFRVRLQAPITTNRTPAQDWDGAHVWLRYHSPQELYALSFRRRDGSIVIKRKLPAADASAVDGGDYATVASGVHALTYGDWHRVEARAANRAGGVELRLSIDGTLVLHTVDRTPGPLTGPGGVGLRVDNTQLWFGDFRAR